MSTTLGLSAADREAKGKKQAPEMIIEANRNRRLFFMATSVVKFLNVDPKGAEAFLAVGKRGIKLVVPGFHASNLPTPFLWSSARRVLFDLESGVMFSLP